MVKPLWALAGVALLGTAGVAGALVVASSGGEEEVVQLGTTGTATSGLTPTPSQPPPPTTVPVTASPAPTPVPSADSIPADWQTYTDPDLGFSIRYPPDLVFKDLTSPSGTGRVLDFRASKDAARAVSIEIYSNPEGIAPRDWALAETACVPESIEATTVAGIAAISCTEQAGERPHPSVVLVHEGMTYEIGSLLPQAEFDKVLESLRL